MPEFIQQTADGITLSTDMHGNMIRVQANSYTSVLFATQHFQARDTNDYNKWTAAGLARQMQVLIVATEYIDKRFGVHFKGKRLQSTSPHDPVGGFYQELFFPRTGLVDVDDREIVGIPLKLQQATSEYGIRLLDGVLWEDHEATISGSGRGTVSGQINSSIDIPQGAITKTKIDVIELDREPAGTRTYSSLFRADSSRTTDAIHKVNPYPDVDYLLTEYIEEGSLNTGSIRTIELLR